MNLQFSLAFNYKKTFFCIKSTTALICVEKKVKQSHKKIIIIVVYSCKNLLVLRVRCFFTEKWADCSGPGPSLRHHRVARLIQQNQVQFQPVSSATIGFIVVL